MDVRAALAASIDHTLLAPEASAAEVEQHCLDGEDMGVAAICVSPSRVALASDVLGGRLPVASVAGFPSGAHRIGTVAGDAARAVEDGAVEIDVVAPLGLIADGDWSEVARHLATVRAEVPDVVLKVIVESALHSSERLVDICRVAQDSGADFVKTSTGFHPSGGATLEAVRVMRSAVGAGVGVKASGGIRDRATALAMLEAGANRLGCSSTAAILSGA